LPVALGGLVGEGDARRDVEIVELAPVGLPVAELARRVTYFTISSREETVIRSP
jgi:hypothetical protein